MLGWEITVIRPREPLVGPNDPRLDPSRQMFGSLRESPDLHGVTLARWSADLGGLEWLEPAAWKLRDGGYPSIYAVPADVLLTKRDRLSVRPSFMDNSPLDLSAVAAIPAGEWILVEAWDQS
ncbi:hypothetical protein [Prescottella agglutinans]|uniref:Uncharacterized protein n=1 Tax=Prescottella agglutinans TaxID=1644129 RepID=A0ABT6MLN9_9NOCA|nr:hypothetical protein [Prescottella agglutinans]MDH6284334.1 hypothetical protein [Prescottella agglutinans]